MWCHSNTTFSMKWMKRWTDLPIFSTSIHSPWWWWCVWFTCARKRSHDDYQQSTVFKLDNKITELRDKETPLVRSSNDPVKAISIQDTVDNVTECNAVNSSARRVHVRVISEITQSVNDQKRHLHLISMKNTHIYYFYYYYARNVAIETTGRDGCLIQEEIRPVKRFGRRWQKIEFPRGMQGRARASHLWR